MLSFFQNPVTDYSLKPEFSQNRKSPKPKKPKTDFPTDCAPKPFFKNRLPKADFSTNLKSHKCIQNLSPRSSRPVGRNFFGPKMLCGISDEKGPETQLDYRFFFMRL